MSETISGSSSSDYIHDSLYWYWNVGNLPPITESPFPVEIRLYVHGLIDGDCYVMSCDGQTLSAQISIPDTSGKRYKMMIPVSNSKPLSRIFNELIKKRIFQLPDENNLDFKKTLRDGVYYVIEYKVFGVYRRYTFSNPKVYRKYHARIRELADYVEVTKLFYSLDM